MISWWYLLVTIDSKWTIASGRGLLIKNEYIIYINIDVYIFHIERKLFHFIHGNSPDLCLKSKKWSEAVKILKPPEPEAQKKTRFIAFSLTAHPPISHA